MADDIHAPTTPQPVWTPYDPDDCIGDFGWLWLDGPIGHEWVLIHTYGEEDGLFVDLIGRMESDGTRASPSAHRYAGTPYLSLLQPTAEPGKGDALEVSVRGPGGFLVAMAFGDHEGAAKVQADVFAAMGMGRGGDG